MWHSRENEECSQSSFGNWPISSQKGPSDVIHLHFLSSPTIRTPPHFNKSFILNQKHKGGLKPQHLHGLAKVHSPQVRAEEMSLVLLLNPLPFRKLGFLVGKQTQGHVFPPQNSLCWSTSTQPTFIHPRVVHQRRPWILWHSSPWKVRSVSFFLVLGCPVTALTSGVWQNWCNANSKSSL